MAEIVLTVQDLSKNFGALRAVDAVSFRVHQGEIVGLIGPNGAGKTTAINLITGVLGKTAGKVLFGGRDISRLLPFQVARLGIARTFQISKPFPRMTVLENIVAAGLFGKRDRRRNIRGAEEEAQKIADLTGMSRKMQTPVTQLTLPDCKRLELCRSLAMHPSLLLLDEVMAGLNPKEVEEMLTLLKKLKEDRGLTILFIEHVMKAIMSISDRIIVMDHGKKIAEDDAENISTNPMVIEAYLGKRYAKRKRQK